MRGQRLLWLLLCGMLLVIPSPQANAGPFSFSGLGDLPGGQTFSFPHGVSADGSVVVGNSDSTLGREAFRWTSDSGMVGLGYLSETVGYGSPYSVASSVSADGSVIVGGSKTDSPSGRPETRRGAGRGACPSCGAPLPPCSRRKRATRVPSRRGTRPCGAGHRSLHGMVVAAQAARFAREFVQRRLPGVLSSSFRCSRPSSHLLSWRSSSVDVHSTR